MTRLYRTRSGRILVDILATFALSSTPIQLSLASDGGASAEEHGVANQVVHTNRGSEIDCITPEGQRVAVPGADERIPNASALMIDNDTLSCPLQEGKTTFIISFPTVSLVDRFTFINENAGVQGEMRIAVSNYRLPADSPQWTEVSGKTAFISKRLFNLSLVGVEARYVRLSFHVEKGGHIASVGRLGGLVP